MTGLDLSEIVSACQENPGLRALVASGRAAGARDVFAGIRRLAPELDWSEWATTGGIFDLPNGSRIRVAYVPPGDAVRRHGSANYQLIVTDGLDPDDRLFLTIRVRATTSGPLVLGIHTLTEKAGV